MVSQLTAINIAKMITIAIVIGLIAIVGISDQRQILYACMHISYCVWWLVEQRIYPERRTFLFQEKVGPIGLISAILIIGVFYSLPAFLAFFNPNPLTIAATATAIPLFYFGSLINTSADVQKMTAIEEWKAVLHKMFESPYYAKVMIGVGILVNIVLVITESSWYAYYAIAEAEQDDASTE